MTLIGRPIDFWMAATSSRGVPPGKSRSNLVRACLSAEARGALDASCWLIAGKTVAIVMQRVATRRNVMGMVIGFLVSARYTTVNS